MFFDETLIFHLVMQSWRGKNKTKWGFFALNLTNKVYFWSKEILPQKEEIPIGKKDFSKEFSSGLRSEWLHKEEVILGRGEGPTVSPKKNIS